MANLSIDKKILFLVGIVFILFVIGLTGVITTTSASNLTQVKQAELDRTSRILSNQITDMESNAILTVRNFGDNKQIAEELKLITNFGPYYADPGSYFQSDYLTTQATIESADQIYAFQAQLTVIQLLQSIQRLNNLTTISYYALAPFDLAPDMDPVLVLRLGADSIDVVRFVQKGAVTADSQLTYQVAKDVFVPPAPDYFDISSAYSAPPEQFYAENGFVQTTAVLPDQFFPQSWEKTDAPRSEIIIRDGIPILQTWFPVTVPIPHPETWAETPEPVGLAMVEQNLNIAALDTLKGRLGLDVGLAQDGSLLITTIDGPVSTSSRMVLPTNNRIQFNAGEFFYRQYPLTLTSTGTNNFSVLVFSPLTELTTLTSRLPRQIGFAAAITMVLAGLLVYFAIRYAVTLPLAALLGTVKQITDGDLAQLVQVRSQDELGVLGTAFNSMTAQLRDLVSTLEQRVAARTQALATSAEVSRSLSTILDTDQLIDEVVTQIQNAFNFYHTHIYLFDEAQENLVMVGGTGKASEIMLAQGHKIPRGKGLVGHAADMQTAVFVPDVSQDSNWLPNALLPETKAEVAIPIILGTQILGVLDVQHNRLNELSHDNVALLQSIANQIAIALQNARQIEQTNESRERFSLAVAGSNDGIWDWDIRTDQIYFSPRWKEMLGYEDYEISNHFHEFENRIHPKDHDWAMQVITDYLQAKTPSYELEVRLQHKDGSYRWILVRGTAQRDEKGIPIRLAGSHSDITQRKQAEEFAAKQATDLQAVAEINTVAMSIANTQEMLPAVIQLIKEKFNLYHAHIYLLNENGDTLLLTAGAGTVGQQMIQENHHIPLSYRQSLVARVARSRHSLLINNVVADPDFLPNPLLPHTQAELAIPLIAGEMVLGVLDVQADKAGFFTRVDVSVQTTLATQLAASIRSARALEQTEQAVAQLNTLTQRLTREGWEQFLQEAPEAGFTFVYDKEQAQQLTSVEDKEHLALNQVLQVRNQEIGTVAMTEPQALSAEAQEIVAAVAARLSAHIENLRLSRQTELALQRTNTLYHAGQTLLTANYLPDLLQVTATSIAEAVHAYRTMVVLIDMEQQRVTHLIGGGPGNKDVQLSITFTQVWEGLSGWVIRERQPILSLKGEPDAREGESARHHRQQTNLGSIIVTPLIYQDHILGTVTAINRADQPDFRQGDMDLMMTLTAQAAAAINNRLLAQQLQTHARQEQTLREVTARIYAAPDTEAVLYTAAQEVNRALGLNAFVYLEQGISEEQSDTNGHREKS